MSIVIETNIIMVKLLSINRTFVITQSIRVKDIIFPSNTNKLFGKGIRMKHTYYPNIFLTVILLLAGLGFSPMPPVQAQAK